MTKKKNADIAAGLSGCGQGCMGVGCLLILVGLAIPFLFLAFAAVCSLFE